MPDIPPESRIISRLEAATDSVAADVDEQYRGRLCRLVECGDESAVSPPGGPGRGRAIGVSDFLPPQRQGEFHIDSSADLWHLLETITRHKILKHVEKLRAGKRDPKREEYPEGDDFRGRGPTPEEAAIAADLMEEALAGMDEIHVQVLHMRLQKCSEEEIADMLSCSRGRVHTKLTRIRQRIQQLSDDMSQAGPIRMKGAQ